MYPFHKEQKHCDCHYRSTKAIIDPVSSFELQSMKRIGNILDYAENNLASNERRSFWGGDV